MKPKLLTPLQKCVSKIAYETRIDANTALKDFQSRPNCRSKKVYYCATCGKYHLSSHLETKKRERKIDRMIGKLKKEGRI